MVNYTALTASSTFNQVFETRSITLPVSALVALCLFSETDGYVQPNVNHHFINKNNSFTKLDTAVRAAIEGKGTVSTEFDAILIQRVQTTRGNDEAVLPCYHVVTEKQSESTQVKVVDGIVLDAFIHHLDSLKKEIFSYKGSIGNFSALINVIQQKTGGLAFAFLDGLHRSFSLINMANQDLKPLFESSMSVTINVSVLQVDENKGKPGKVKKLSITENLVRVEGKHQEILLELLQGKSGELMLQKKATVGHTILDAFSVLSRSMRNNGDNAYLTVATWDVPNKLNKKDYRSVIIDYSTGPDNDAHLEKLKTKGYLEKFFKVFFFNDGFEEMAKQGLPLRVRKDMLKENGTYNIEEVYKGFFSHNKWEILFSLKGESRYTRSIICERGSCGKNNKLYGVTNLSYGNMLLISMSRLFFFTPTIRENSIKNMTFMQTNGILSKERLLFITGIADDVATLLLSFYNSNPNPKKKLQTKMPIRFVIRTNVENLLLSLYSEEIFDKVLGSEFEVKHRLPYKSEFEQQILFSMWELNTSLSVDVAKKMTFVDGLVFSYGRYILYLLMGAKIYKPILPILDILLSSESRKKQSKKIGKESDRERPVCTKLFKKFEINQDFTFSDISMFLKPTEFVKSCMEKMHEKDKSPPNEWNPVYPLPYLIHKMKGINLSRNEATIRNNLIQTWEKYHNDDTAFNKDIISPQKRKKIPSSTSPATKKSKKEEEEHSDDDAVMVMKKDHEYGFVGFPVNTELENEPLDNSQENESKTNKPAETTEKSYIENPSNSSHETSVVEHSSNKSTEKDNEANKPNENETSENNEELTTKDVDVEFTNSRDDYDTNNNDKEMPSQEGIDNPEQNQDSPQTRSKTKKAEKENEEHEETELVEQESVDTDPIYKKGISFNQTIDEDRFYFLQKALATFRFVFTEQFKSNSNPNGEMSMWEVALILYWSSHIKNSRKFMTEHHFSCMDDLFYDGIYKDFVNREGFLNFSNFQPDQKSLLDSSLYLLRGIANHFQGANKDFRNALENAKAESEYFKNNKRKLRAIFRKYPLSQNPFVASLRNPSDYEESGDDLIQFEKNMVFLQPDRQTIRKIQVFPDLKTSTKDIQDIKSIVEKALNTPTLTSGDVVSPPQQFDYTFNETIEFIQKVVFESNEVIACKNFIAIDTEEDVNQDESDSSSTKVSDQRLGDVGQDENDSSTTGDIENYDRDPWIRFNFRDDESKTQFFIEDNIYNMLWKIQDTKNTMTVSPYDSYNQYPVYYDFFKIEPNKGLSLKQVSQILNVTEKKLESIMINGVHWYKCNDRRALHKACFSEHARKYKYNQIWDDDDHAPIEDDDELFNFDANEGENDGDNDIGYDSNKPNTRSQTNQTTSTEDNLGRFEEKDGKYYFDFEGEQYIRFGYPFSEGETIYYWFKGLFSTDETHEQLPN